MDNIKLKKLNVIMGRDCDQIAKVFTDNPDILHYANFGSLIHPSLISKNIHTILNFICVIKDESLLIHVISLEVLQALVPIIESLGLEDDFQIVRLGECIHIQ